MSAPSSEQGPREWFLRGFAAGVRAERVDGVRCNWGPALFFLGTMVGVIVSWAVQL